MQYVIIDLNSGDNRTIRLYVKNPDLDIVNLTGATCLFTVKTDKEISAITFQKSTAVSGQGEIGDIELGEVFFYIVPEDTESIDIRQYVFDIRVNLANGKTYTVLEGVIDLQKSID